MGDVAGLDFDVVEASIGSGQGFYGALVLVQQGDGVDQGEVLFMIAAGAGFVGEEGELVGVGVDHCQGA